MTVGVNPKRFRLGANTAIGALLGDESEGVALDFLTMKAIVRDAAPAFTYQDLFDYADQTALEAAGWTVSEGGGAAGVTVSSGVVTIADVGGTDSYITRRVEGGTWDCYVDITAKTASVATSVLFRIGSTAAGNTIANVLIGAFTPNPGVWQSVGTFTVDAGFFITLYSATTGLGMSFGGIRMVRQNRNTVSTVPIVMAVSNVPATRYLTNAFGVLENGITLRCHHDVTTLDSSASTLSSLGVGGGVQLRQSVVTTGAYAYTTGNYIRLTDAANINNWIIARVVSFDPSTKVLTFNSYDASSVFTASSWKVIVAFGTITEPARTNLLLQSQDFASASWTKTNTTVVSNTINAPDGTLTADKMVSTVATIGMNFNNAVTITPTAVAHAFSVYAKKGEARYLQLLESGSSNGFANFDLELGVVGTTSLWTSSIEKLLDGWYRCIVYTDVLTLTASSFRYALVPAANSARNASFIGNGVDGLYLWGAQLEAISTSVPTPFATSYVPTTASSATRAADTSDCHVGAIPLSLTAVGTMLWSGHAVAVDANGGTGNETGRTLRLHISPDTGAASNTHYLVISKSDSSSRVHCVHPVFRNETGSIDNADWVAHNGFPTAPPGNTIGMSWSAAGFYMASGALPGQSVSDTFDFTIPYRFRYFGIAGGLLPTYHRNAIYLPRVMSLQELIARCSEPPTMTLLPSLPSHPLLERLVDIRLETDR
jgi:hypothetical protein